MLKPGGVGGGGTSNLGTSKHFMNESNFLMPHQSTIIPKDDLDLVESGSQKMLNEKTFDPKKTSGFSTERQRPKPTKLVSQKRTSMGEVGKKSKEVKKKEAKVSERVSNEVTQDQTLIIG